MFFNKKTTHTPSIHEMRMEQLFPSSSYNTKNKKNRGRNSKKNTNYELGLFGVKEAEIPKDKTSLLKHSVDFINNFDVKDLDLFQMGPETANDYYLYKMKKESKIRRSNFSFYDIDGSINYLRVFSGLFSENIYVKAKAKSLFIDTFADFLKSQVFIDYFSMIFSCSVVAFLIFNLFVNASTFFKYSLNFLF